MRTRKYFAAGVTAFFCMSMFSVQVRAATVPMEMEPGTEIVYDDEGKPIFVKGGIQDFIEWEDLNGKMQKKEIPKDIPLNGQMKMVQERDMLAVMIRDFRDSQDVIHVMPPDVVPNMKAIYNGETGAIDHIYYADKNEPSGYSLHGDERLQEQDTQKTHKLYQQEKKFLKRICDPFLYFW